MVKRKPHHSLSSVKAKFAEVETVSITGAAVRTAAALGYDVAAVMAVVRRLSPTDFVKSETAHSPPNSRVWHDSYRTRDGDLLLYLKFAGETLVELTLTSFKEA
ncbi:type II toxin-antitoxin system MqsR family toxin [Sphingomonas sp.]|uniref:type II toxin-antitoxin system MqsR family toxin n=1 Tax=Sphingomonas sp. TaxID=28214 RepID=UPI003AFF7495